MKRLLGLLAVATLTVAQASTIGAGTTIAVRTNETIDAKKSDGRVFSGVVNQDVMDANGNVAVPKGANAELIVKKISDRELLLDLESVTVNGQRYAVTSDATRQICEEREGACPRGHHARTCGGAPECANDA